jgi:hypothetical protein
MALGEADRRPPVIDFLHVRARPTPQRFTRVHALAGAAVAVLFLGLLVHFWRQAAAPRRELEAVKAELTSIGSQGKQYAQVVARAAAVEDWLSSDVNWLDELDRLSRLWRPQPLASKEFPVSGDAVVTQLVAISPQGSDSRGGFFDLRTMAKSAAAVAPLERRLRDDNHRVTTGGGKKDGSVPGYDWSIGLQVYVPPQSDAAGETP